MTKSTTLSQLPPMDWQTLMTVMAAVRRFQAELHDSSAPGDREEILSMEHFADGETEPLSSDAIDALIESWWSAPEANAASTPTKPSESAVARHLHGSR